MRMDREMLKVKKFFFSFLFGVLFVAVLSGCKGSTEIESGALPSSPMDHSTAIPSPSIAPEIAEDELCDVFKQVFDSCGSSSSPKDDQLTAELEALKSKADSSKMTWPKNYEDRYKDWRRNVIAERIALLTAEYDEIIAGRKCCTPPLYEPSSQMALRKSRLVLRRLSRYG